MYLTLRSSRLAAFFQTLMIILLAAAGCVLAAMAAVSNSPIIIALVAGAVIGAVLLPRLDIVVWILLIGCLIGSGLISLALPSISKVTWVLSLLGFYLLFGSGLIALVPKRKDPIRVPGFVTTLLIFMFGSIAASLLVNGEILETIVGTKRSFQLIGVMVMMAMLPKGGVSERRIALWLGTCVAIAYIQLPLALFQRIVLVPKRAGLWASGVAPLDIVSGTFEASLEGGGSSSVMVIFLATILTYVLAKWRENAMSTRSMVAASVMFGAPFFLGETKIALVLVPMIFLLVFAAQIRHRPLQTALIGALGLGLTAVLAWTYFAVLATGNLSPGEQFEKALRYNFGDLGYYNRSSLNRTSAVIFWFQEHGLHNPVETFFGHGLGSSYSGTSNLVPGHLNREYRFIPINLTTLSTLLWDTGLIGAGLFVGSLLSAWRASSRLIGWRVDPEFRARIVALRFSLFSIALAVVYSNSLVSSLSHGMIFAFTLGYLAWLVRCAELPSKARGKANATSASVPYARVLPELPT
jgi:hypothetical protein